MKLERTKQFDDALAHMSGREPFVFITGRAGTGKSTLLTYFRDTVDPTVPVLAPTGVAALNVQGETIHRFFRFTPGITARDARKKGKAARESGLYRSLTTIIIDEISMVRADLLDCVDVFLRAARKTDRPFGGVRIIAIGDLYQLPPVVTSSDKDAFFQLYRTPYFFSSAVVSELVSTHQLAFIELETIYRQTDPAFIALLNAVRNRSITPEQLDQLNQRIGIAADKDTVILTPTNDAADEINAKRLAALPGKRRFFDAEVRGEFPPRDMPTDERLTLAIGARVMCVVNDTGGQYVNGSLGWVRRFTKADDGTPAVVVAIDDGSEALVTPYTWTLYRSIYNAAERRLDQESLGSFRQLPLKLAWAMTIHKSQGKTFDAVDLQLGRGAFAHGQVYVALSRCRSFEGLTLTKPVTAGQIRLDYAIQKFVTSLQYQRARQAVDTNTLIARLRAAAKAKQRVTITYLKAKDEKTRREIQPISIKWDEFNGHEYQKLRAFCYLRGEERFFNVERILELTDK